MVCSLMVGWLQKFEISDPAKVVHVNSMRGSQWPQTMRFNLDYGLNATKMSMKLPRQNTPSMQIHWPVSAIPFQKLPAQSIPSYTIARCHHAEVLSEFFGCLPWSNEAWDEAAMFAFQICEIPGLLHQSTIQCTGERKDAIKYRTLFTTFYFFSFWFRVDANSGYPLSIKYPKALSFRPAPGSTTNSGREFLSDGGE